MTEQPFADDRLLDVALIGFSDRDRAMMELFIRKFCSAECRLAPKESASLCILDLDGLQGQALLQTEREHNPQRPLVALSVRSQDIDGVHVLRKPLRIGVLKIAIDLYRSELAHPKSVSTAQAQPPRPDSQAKPAAPSNSDAIGFCDSDPRNALCTLESQNRIVRECCGTAGSIDFGVGRGAPNLYYDPGNLFQEQLQNAVSRCRQDNRPVSLHLWDGKSIILLPGVERALTDLSDAKLRPRTLMEVQPDQIRIERFESADIHLLYDNPERTQPTDALLWKVALWSARGRLPRGTDIDAPVRLRRWPNLTRLLWIPQFMRIAALWAHNPLSLVETVKTLDMEARYVCAFFSACHALGLAQTQLGDTSAKATSISSPELSHPGLLRRILRRLRIV